MIQRTMGVVAILGAIVSACFAWTTRAEPPRLNVPESITLDAGSPETLQTVEVPIENPCSYPIEILEVVPSCSCTVVQLVDSVIRPGSASTMTVHVEVGKAPIQGTVTLNFHGVGSSIVAHATVNVRSPAGTAVADR